MALSQRERDIDAAVRKAVPFTGWRVYMSFAPNFVTETRARWIREHFARIQSTRQAAPHSLQLCS
jgi:hypothetical protein